MAEGWLQLAASPEWRQLSRQFPEQVQRLEAVMSEGSSRGGRGSGGSSGGGEGVEAGGSTSLDGPATSAAAGS